MTNDLLSYRNKLNNLFTKVSVSNNNNAEMMSHWAKYLCVRCAGFVETAIPKLLLEYSKEHSHNRQVLKYIEIQLDSIQNVKAEKIVTIVGSFDRTWAVQVEEFMDEEGRKEAINSIVAQRHLIAHGKDSSMTFASLKGYL